MARNVDATAASWGEFPNGVATKNDQLASDNLCVRVRRLSQRPLRSTRASNEPEEQMYNQD
jgi:hypothetical protein